MEHRLLAGLSAAGRCPPGHLAVSRALCGSGCAWLGGAHAGARHERSTRCPPCPARPAPATRPKSPASASPAICAPVQRGPIVLSLLGPVHCLLRHAHHRSGSAVRGPAAAGRPLAQAHGCHVCLQGRGQLARHALHCLAQHAPHLALGTPTAAQPERRAGSRGSDGVARWRPLCWPAAKAGRVTAQHSTTRHSTTQHGTAQQTPRDAELLSRRLLARHATAATCLHPALTIGVQVRHVYQPVHEEGDQGGLRVARVEQRAPVLQMRRGG